MEIKRVQARVRMTAPGYMYRFIAWGGAVEPRDRKETTAKEWLTLVDNVAGLRMQRETAWSPYLRWFRVVPRSR
jgi:hypothetical protein